MSNERCTAYKQLFADMLDFYCEHAVLDTGEIICTDQVEAGTHDIVSRYNFDALGIDLSNVALMSRAALEMAQAAKLEVRCMSPEDFYGRA